MSAAHIRLGVELNFKGDGGWRPQAGAPAFSAFQIRGDDYAFNVGLLERRDRAALLGASHRHHRRHGAAPAAAEQPRRRARKPVRCRRPAARRGTASCAVSPTPGRCRGVAGSPLGGGGFWPKCTPDQYIFQSGIQLAGVIPTNRRLPVAGRHRRRVLRQTPAVG